VEKWAMKGVKLRLKLEDFIQPGNVVEGLVYVFKQEVENNTREDFLPLPLPSLASSLFACIPLFLSFLASWLLIPQRFFRRISINL
jgi:hypothetical protein